MADYGLTPTGPVPKTTAIVLEELRARCRGLYGSGAPLGSQTLLGELVAIVADRCGSLWDLWLAAVTAADPDGAEDAALAVIAAYQLVLQEGPAPSLATLSLTGAAGTSIAAGASATVPGTSTAFATSQGAVLVAVAGWAATTLVAVGDVVTLGGRVYLCVSGGVTGATGPQSTDHAAEVDGAATWRYLGDGAAHASVEALCTVDGPVEALAYSITEVGTSVSGWEGVANPLDALPGRFEQSNNSLRVTRENALARAGSGSPEAIRADVLAVPNVRACSVFHNRTTVVDSDGVPPKSIEALVTGGDDAAVAAALFSSAGAVAEFFGSTSVVVVDSEGVDQVVRFSRPTIVPIWVTITVRRDPLRYPVDGADLVAGKIVAFGDAQDTGRDVDALALAGQVVPLLVGGVLREQVPGVTGASACAVGLAASPSGLSVPISRREFADLDSSRVVVVEVTP